MSGSDAGESRTTVLAIDTATDSVITGVAVVGADGDVEVLAERTVADHRRHAELLTTLMSESLAEAGVARSDLGAVIVGCGPGPFTGLRVGMATGAAFADALSIPAYGVCSLDAIAAQGGPDYHSVVVVTDARRREVYWAQYVDGDRIRGPEVMAPATVRAELDAGATAVDIAFGSPEHVQLVGLRAGGYRVPSVLGLVGCVAGQVIAGSTPDALVPLYLRRPDAVERKAPVVRS